MTIDLKIAENIKRLRLNVALTQEDLAKKADVKYTTLTKIESGVVKSPSIHIIAKLAKALGVGIEELIS